MILSKRPNDSEAPEGSEAWASTVTRVLSKGPLGPAEGLGPKGSKVIGLGKSWGLCSNYMRPCL